MAWDRRRRGRWGGGKKKNTIKIQLKREQQFDYTPSSIVENLCGKAHSCERKRDIIKTYHSICTKHEKESMPVYLKYSLRQSPDSTTLQPWLLRGLCGKAHKRRRRRRLLKKKHSTASTSSMKKKVWGVYVYLPMDERVRGPQAPPPPKKKREERYTRTCTLHGWRFGEGTPVSPKLKKVRKDELGWDRRPLLYTTSMYHPSSAWHVPAETRFSADETKIVQCDLDKPLAKKVIVPCDHEPGE